MTDRIDDFLSRCSQALTEQAAIAPVQRAAAAEGAAAFANALGDASRRPFEPSWLPVLETIDQVEDTDLARSFAAIARDLPWMPTFRATDEGTSFALSPMNEVRELTDVTVGVMYVAPGAQYPLHNHRPQELYLTLSGEATWRYGGNEGFEKIGPLRTIYNNPNDLHSAIAGQTPLVALYVLWPTQA